MKERTIKVWYWIVTGIFSLFMIYSGISELMQTEAGNAIIQHLGYPLYINIILGTAKILGVVAILQPWAYTIKEWAYAGFTFDILGATLSFLLNGDGAMSVVTMLPFIAVLFLSYFLWKRMEMR